MKQIIILLIVLIAIGFGVTFIPADSQIKRVVIGIVIFLAILFVVLWVLSLLGVMQMPRLTG